MKKVLISIFFVIGCWGSYSVFLKNNDSIKKSYLTKEYDENSAYFGKLSYDSVNKKAWISGGYGIILFGEINDMLKNGIPENVAEQKEYFNKRLNSKTKDWKKRNPSFAPYEIKPEDYETKIIKPDDPEFFNSLRYHFIKKYELVEASEQYIKKHYKSWFYTFYYVFRKIPSGRINRKYYSTVYPHHEVSEAEHRITIEIW